mgnify:FL=1
MIKKALVLNENDIPAFPRHAKLKNDRARNKWIINAPERVFELDEIASEIIQLVNGEASIEIIINTLCDKFDGAPRDIISKDTLSMLQSLADKGFVVI